GECICGGRAAVEAVVASITGGETVRADRELHELIFRDAEVIQRSGVLAGEVVERVRAIFQSDGAGRASYHDSGALIAGAVLHGDLNDVRRTVCCGRGVVADDVALIVGSDDADDGFAGFGIHGDRDRRGSARRDGAIARVVRNDRITGAAGQSVRGDRGCTAAQLKLRCKIFGEAANGDLWFAARRGEQGNGAGGCGRRDTDDEGGVLPVCDG